MATDRVQVLKLETAALGGTAGDEAPYPAPIEPQEDALESAGLYVQDAAARDETTLVDRSGDDMRFKDGNNTTPVTLSALVAGGASPATTKGDLSGFDSAAARIPVGSNDQVLTADSAQDLGVKWAAASGGSSPLTTKGDVHGFSTVDARVPVGSNDQVLVADSAQALGLKWAAAPLAASPVFDAYDTTGVADISAGVVVPLDTEREKSAEFTHSLVTLNSEVTISTAGVYHVSGQANTQIASSTARSASLMWLELDTGSGFAEVPGTRSLMYNRETNEGGTTGAFTAVMDLAVDDKLRMWVVRNSGNAAMGLLADGSRLTIVGLKGPAGADGEDGAAGAAGATGAGANIIVKDDTVLVGTVMDTINFGTSLAVVNDGSGDCTVNASGGSSIEEYTAWQDTEDTSTDDTTFTDALTLTFTPDDAGDDWLIEWCAEATMDDSDEHGFIQANVDSGTIYTRDWNAFLVASRSKTFSGMFQLSALSAAQHTVSVEFHPDNNWTTMRCRDIFIRARKL